MKNPSKLPALSVLVLASALFAFGARAEDSKPCKEIKAACQAAHYDQGAHKKTGKGLHKDCLQKIFAGEAVEGVSVTPEQVAACKAKKEKHMAKKNAAAG